MQHRDCDQAEHLPCEWDASKAEPLHTGIVNANDMSLAMQHDNRLCQITLSWYAAHNSKHNQHMKLT